MKQKIGSDMWLHGQLGLNEDSILIDFDLWIRERVNKIIYKIRISFLDLRSAVVDSNQRGSFLFHSKSKE